MYRGIIYMLFSSICFAIVNLFVKLLSQENTIFSDLVGLPETQVYPVFQLVFFRSIISLIICIGITRVKGIPFFGYNKKWLIIRGIFGSTALTLFFFTLRNLPIAVATTVQYLSPLFTIIFAIFLLKEKIKPLQWVFIALAMMGVVILGINGKSNGIELSYIWLGFGLLSAILSGVAYNAIMKCRETDAPITVVLYFSIIAAPVTLVLCLLTGYIIPVGFEWFIILFIGLFTQLAQILMTKAFHSDTAANVTPVKYIGAVYASFMGIFIFGEFINFYAYLGIITILIAVLLNTIYKSRKTSSLANNSTRKV